MKAEAHQTKSNGIEPSPPVDIEVVNSTAGPENSESFRNLPTVVTDPLGDLAEEINVSYRQALKHAQAWICEARSCGILLLQAKARVNHGDWLAWLKRNFPGSADTAENWMKIAANWSWLQEQVYGPKVLSVDGALKILRAEKTKRSMLSAREKMVAEILRQLPEELELWADEEVHFFGRVLGDWVELVHRELGPVVAVLKQAKRNFEAATFRLEPNADEPLWHAAKTTLAQEIGYAFRGQKLSRFQLMLIRQHLPEGWQRMLPWWLGAKFIQCDGEEGPADWVDG